MFRSLFAALVVAFVVGCGPADSVSTGRCTADAQCPVGASCDETIGVCVAGGSTSSGTQTTGVNQSQPNALPSGYGRYCESNAECSGVAGTSCLFNACVKSCSSAGTCDAGTACAGNNGTFGCFQSCAMNPCLNGGTCSPAPTGPAMGERICVPKAPASLSGKCSKDSDCRAELRCTINAKHPEGYCSMGCSTDADCYNGFDACIVPAGSTSGMCMPKCGFSPNATCREGTTCTAVGNASFSVCY